MRRFVFLVGFAITFYFHGQTGYEALDTLFRFIDEKDPGCFISIRKDGESLYTRGFGLAEIPRNKQINDRTNFRVASNSKQFTAYSILLLREQGLLNLHDTIRKILPELPACYSTITIRQLLTHTSGVRDYSDLHLLTCKPFSCDRFYPYTLICNQNKLNFKPGSFFMYSNSNYYLLGLIVERLTKLPLHGYIKQNIFQPLGMNQSGFSEDSLLQNAAIGYRKSESKWIPDPPDYCGVYGEGGLVTNGVDIAQWLDHLKNKSNIVAEMERCESLSNGNLSHNGMGVFIYENPEIPGSDKRILIHGGNRNSFSSQWVRIPGLKLEIVCLSNQNEFPYNKICQSMINFILDSTKKVRPIFEMDKVVELNDSLTGFYIDTLSNEYTFSEKSLKSVLVQPSLIYLKDTLEVFYTRDWYMKQKRRFYKTGGKNIMQIIRDVDTISLVHLPYQNLSGDLLGDYYCGELDSLKFSVKRKKGKYYFLVDEKYIATVEDSFRDACMISTFHCFIQFKRDKTGNVNSFELSTNRLKKLKFVR